MSIDQPATVLVVDDELSLRKFVATTLSARGYRVLQAADGAEALEMLTNSEGIDRVQLVILDVAMPRLGGLEVLTELRRWSQVPVIVLSVLGEEADKVRALDLGADDYLTKPFGVPELLARVRAALRRAQAAGSPPTASRLTVGDLVIDFARRLVTVGGREVKLTRVEYVLLAELANNAGKVLTHSTLLQRVWGPEYGDEHNYLRVFVRRLRQKLEPNPDQPQYIVTMPGVGYRLRE